MNIKQINIVDFYEFKLKRFHDFYFEFFTSENHLLVAHWQWAIALESSSIGNLRNG